MLVELTRVFPQELAKYRAIRGDEWTEYKTNYLNQCNIFLLIFLLYFNHLYNKYLLNKQIFIIYVLWTYIIVINCNINCNLDYAIKYNKIIKIKFNMNN